MTIIALEVAEPCPLKKPDHSPTNISVVFNGKSVDGYGAVKFDKIATKFEFSSQISKACFGRIGRSD